MGTTMRDRLTRVRAYVSTRLASTALVLLATPIALAVPAAGAPAVTTHVKLAGTITEYHPIGDEFFPRTSSTPVAPHALARGASTTGEFDDPRPEFAFSTRSRQAATPGAPSSSVGQIVMSSRAAGNPTPDKVVVTLGAGSRLFGSHVPISPVDGSSLSGSSGLAGVLTLASTGTLGAADAGRPPLPPYGRRTTWTFRTPSTRPG